MRAIQIPFSPTGGTQRVSDCILEQWPDPTVKLDLTKAGGIGLVPSAGNQLESFTDGRR